MIKEELKPCPFCGHEASKTEETRGITCIYCGARMVYDLDPKKNVSLLAWNTRVLDEEKEEMFEMLKSTYAFVKCNTVLEIDPGFLKKYSQLIDRLENK